jgi:GNAT superfamily N-acetyltransferase
MWRIALTADDESIAEMCSLLYIEDPGQSPIPPENIHRTLTMLRSDPKRGRAVVLDIEGKLSGYALLIAYWSNELGGEICQVDELFVTRERRNQGYGSALFNAIEDLWPGTIGAIALGTTPNNVKARRLYQRLGFTEIGNTMVRRAW